MPCGKRSALRLVFSPSSKLPRGATSLARSAMESAAASPNPSRFVNFSGIGF
jgi:hypothetical protein